jgi:hypothetical protein
MNLDVNTLFLITIYVEAMLGLLLLFAWVQNANIYAVAWWGCAHLLRAGSVMLFGMYGSVPDLVSIDLANAILFTSFAVTWTGARVFDGRSPRYGYLFAGALIWLVFCRMPFFAEALNARVLISSGIITAYTWATAYEFWRGRSEPLVSRWPAIFMLFAHGSLFLLRTPLAAILPWRTDDQVFASVWLTVLSFEALLFTIAIAFILLAMAKERTELRHKTAAMIDPLTGIANRRAFLEDAAELTRRQAVEPKPVAVFAIDLDQFKSINDRFGHAVGDRVIQIFADTARQPAIVRSHRAARRRGIRRSAPRHGARACACHGGTHPQRLRDRGVGSRWAPSLRHGLLRRGGIGGGDARHREPARPGGSGALLRQDARSQPGRICLA